METVTSPCPVFEFRQYTLHPGRRDDLIDLFEREFIEPQLEAGIALAGLFRDAERPDRFVWIRSFPDMDARRDALSAFYGGSSWRAHRDEANATMIDSDNVLLLRPAAPEPSLRPGTFRGPIFAATFLFATAAEASEFAGRVLQKPEEARNEGANLLAVLVTEYAQNTFLGLPVREGEHAAVLITDGLERERLNAFGRTPDEIAHLIPTARSAMQPARTGTRGDFDFLVGRWNVEHRKLRSRLSGSSDWLSESGPYRGYSLADGVLSVDEFAFPSRGTKGCSIRTLDLAARRWTIHWTTSESGQLFAPVHGGFADGRGEFYGTDVCEKTRVLARYLWLDCAGTHPRWEQAFSTDGGATWETNWTMEFTRA